MQGPWVGLVFLFLCQGKVWLKWNSCCGVIISVAAAYPMTKPMLQVQALVLGRECLRAGCRQEFLQHGKVV